MSFQLLSSEKKQLEFANSYKSIDAKMHYFHMNYIEEKRGMHIGAHSLS